MDNELKETKKMMSHQEESINKEIEIVKRNEIEILELKSTITEIKNSLMWFITNLDVKKIDRGRTGQNVMKNMNVHIQETQEIAN